MRETARKWMTAAIGLGIVAGLLVGASDPGAAASTGKTGAAKSGAAPAPPAAVATGSGSWASTESTGNRWKIIMTSTSSGVDMGLGYEWTRVKFQRGPVELPLLTADFILTPVRVGFGGSIEVTDKLSLVTGFSLCQTGVQEGYVGLGIRFNS